MNPQPVTLDGEFVRLEPLSLDHVNALCEEGTDEAVWRYMTSVMNGPDDMLAYIETALKEQQGGVSLPFAIVDKRTGKAVGSTRFGNIDRANRRLEIGWTWVVRSCQRTPINTQAKLLLLTHAFESLGCIRVEFKTDSLNEQSQRALSRIGAKQEGIFRNHMILPSGRIRHSVFFSIIESEWPEVKSALQSRLDS